MYWNILDQNSYFTFFGHDGKHNVKEAPLNMLIAMGIAAVMYRHRHHAAALLPDLPYEMSYQPYDASHIIGQMQLLIFAMLAFVFLMWAKLYPPEIRSTVLNADWFYRRLAPMIVAPLVRPSSALPVCWNGLLSSWAVSFPAPVRILPNIRLPDLLCPGLLLWCSSVC